MKFKNLFLFAAIAMLASCGKYEFDASQVNQELSLQRAKNQLGVDIDPNQNWRPIRHGSVTITANADLKNIVKVQLLTESPFGNDEAEILVSKDCKAGQQVTLNYEAPDYLTELVAACVDDKGVYYIKVFDIDKASVDFQEGSNARNRASVFDDYPSEIILGGCIKSFNAERAEASENSKDYHDVLCYESTNASGTKRYYNCWYRSSWEDDRLWDHQRVSGDGRWTVEGGTISRTVSDKVDLATVTKIVDKALPKTGGSNTTNGKANNWQKFAQSNEYAIDFNNYLTSDGNPTVLVPLQMWTTEGNLNTIYYYYFDPNKVSSADDIKRLPKFRAINGFTQKNNVFNRDREYLLPYYGDSPSEGTWASPAIPAGYRIGFLNRKDFGSMYSSGSGCTYGDGSLNVEVNHLVGHYFSAMSSEIRQTFQNPDGNKSAINGKTVQGMQYDSPRIGVFSANNRTYLCFEDGADCNFRDMIVEVKHGSVILESTEAPTVRKTAYTMCFEDRPLQADYDMNDVVLTAERTGDTQVTLTLLACGAKDKVTLHGITNSKEFEGKEIHALLGLSDDSPYFNTVIGGNYGPGVSETIDIGNMSIEDFLAAIYITNEESGQDIHFPGSGEAPASIIVPANFNYPKEGTSIVKSYPNFLEWAQDMNASKDWYRSTEGVDRYPLLFLNQ